ncbi:hypothetical protein [Shewanella benthica]|nr:hypothetical protein [Shewanella benthica]
MAAVSYKQQTEYYTKLDVELDGDEQQAQVENSKNIVGTDSIVQISAMINMGFEFNEDHKIDPSYSFFPSESMAIKPKAKNILGEESEYLQLVIIVLKVKILKA